MQPTKRIKVKNGIEYWYEETPYYDKKQIRHRSKYLQEEMLMASQFGCVPLLRRSKRRRKRRRNLLPLSMANQKSPVMAMKFPQIYLRLFHFAVQA